MRSKFTANEFERMLGALRVTPPEQGETFKSLTQRLRVACHGGENSAFHKHYIDLQAVDAVLSALGGWRMKVRLVVRGMLDGSKVEGRLRLLRLVRSLGEDETLAGVRFKTSYVATRKARHGR